VGNWASGEDLARRIADHRKSLGQGEDPMPQAEYVKLWGRTDFKTVLDWEKGRRRPSGKLIQQVVSRNGWDGRMFQEGGPMPSTLPQGHAEGLIPPDLPLIGSGVAPYLHTPYALSKALKVFQLEIELAKAKGVLLHRDRVRDLLKPLIEAVRDASNEDPVDPPDDDQGQGGPGAPPPAAPNPPLDRVAGQSGRR
jgi:hypothetical protein